MKAKERMEVLRFLGKIFECVRPPDPPSPIPSLHSEVQIRNGCSITEADTKIS